MALVKAILIGESQSEVGANSVPLVLAVSAKRKPLELTLALADQAISSSS